jgi:ribosomal protein L23
MALFGTKKNTKEKKDTKDVATTTPTALRTDLTHVLKSPRITEKATTSAMKDTYLFDVDTKTTKREIIKALKEFYKVTPIKVNIATYPAKKKRNARTGKGGVKQGGKKAYVYLKKGDTIHIA